MVFPVPLSEERLWREGAVSGGRRSRCGNGPPHVAEDGSEVEPVERAGLVGKNGVFAPVDLGQELIARALRRDNVHDDSPFRDLQGEGELPVAERIDVRARLDPFVREEKDGPVAGPGVAERKVETGGERERAGFVPARLDRQQRRLETFEIGREEPRFVTALIEIAHGIVASHAPVGRIPVPDRLEGEKVEPDVPCSIGVPPQSCEKGADVVRDRPEQPRHGMRGVQAEDDVG